jgi:hypothetical protein
VQAVVPEKLKDLGNEKRRVYTVRDLFPSGKVGLKYLFKYVKLL